MKPDTRKGAMLRKIMNTFSYADKVELLNNDITSHTSQIKFLQESHQLLLSRHNDLRDTVYELKSELEHLRSFVVNDPHSPFVVKVPVKATKPKKKKGK